MVEISAENRIINGAFWNFNDIISALHLRNGESKGLDDIKGIAVAVIKYNDLVSADKFFVESYADEIACHIAPDSLLVQIGCNTNKIAPLLNALKARHGSFKYVVVDESAAAPKDAEIRKTNPKNWDHLDAVKFIQANYSHALKDLRQQHPDSMICVIWDSSSVGELSDTDAVQFLKSVTEAAGSRCQVVWFTGALPRCQMTNDGYVGQKVSIQKLQKNENASNNDEKSIAAHTIKEGLRNVLDSLGYGANADDEKSWIYQTDLNRKLKQVETYLCFSEGLKGVDGQMSIRPGERFLVGISQRFTAEDLIHLASLASFQVHAAWRGNSNGCQILVSVQEALRCCWKDTDRIFELLSNWTRKPIEFRHPYCFYYGHIMAFANLKLFDGEPPSRFDVMFSRGMDPIVVDPSKCHAHPGAPPQWPDIDTLKVYVQRTRGKIMDAVESGLLGMRASNFALEHERMHQETLMYMVVQQRKADFERDPYTDYQESDSLLLGLKNLTLSSGTPDIFVSPGKVCLGANFRETVFLWDNECPILDAVVEKPILVSSKPVTVKNFLKFTLEGGYDKEDLWQPADFVFFHQQRLNCPATWSLVAGDYYVHYAEKTIHWSKVAEQPVFVSLSEAEAFCNWVGCRVMTESEYQRILDCNSDGGAEQLRTGGWEWTSTIFAPFPGFEPMPMYPEYSADFFDGSHYVLKGSSPSTHPSMHRDTFRNFYQRQYPYVFAKFRCCKSIE